MSKELQESIISLFDKCAKACGFVSPQKALYDFAISNDDKNNIHVAFDTKRQPYERKIAERYFVEQLKKTGITIDSSYPETFAVRSHKAYKPTRFKLPVTKATEARLKLALNPEDTEAWTYLVLEGKRDVLCREMKYATNELIQKGTPAIEAHRLVAQTVATSLSLYLSNTPN